MTDYRQHNVHAEVVHAEVVHVEPAKPRPESTDDLAVNLRNEIVRLVTAALGTWDDEANSDEQINEAERRIKELGEVDPERGGAS